MRTAAGAPSATDVASPLHPPKAGIGWTRRRFLAGTLAAAGAAAGGGALLGGLAARRASSAATRRLLLSPQNLTARARGLGVLDLASQRLAFIPTPMLGHSVVGHPVRPDVVAVLGQRPEKRACLVSLSERQVAHVFAATKGRHFYGHGAYSADGSLLYATENDDVSGLGYLVVRDARSLAPLGELPSHGMAPHEVVFTADGAAAVIANGGAVSLEGSYADGALAPSSLCYVDPASGALLDRQQLPDPRLSIRHLALTGRGDVIAALRRYPDDVAAPALALHRPGRALALAQSDAESMARMRSHALSVAIDPTGRVAGVTHPEGDAVSFWEVATGSLLAMTRVEKPEGIAASPGGEFLVTSIRGALVAIDAARFASRPLGSERGLNWKHATYWEVPGAR